MSRVPDIPWVRPFAKREPRLALLTWRGLGNPPARERNSQRAPLGQPVGAVHVSWGVRQGTTPLFAPAGGTNSGTGTPGRLTSACWGRHIQQEQRSTAHA